MPHVARRQPIKGRDPVAQYWIKLSPFEVYLW